jgi:hypothetical protein
MASSRVGAITSAFNPTPLFIISSRGVAKAIVLPDPVSAKIIALFFEAINGIAYIWTGVGLR